MATIGTAVKNPALYGWDAGHNIWVDIKHHRILEHDGYLYQASGDFSGFPRDQRSDYPPNADWGYTGRQDMWRASLTAGASGNIEWELSQNYYANYPWNGSSGRLSPAPQRGPYMPDALGWIVDKRGTFWLGPCTVGYTGATGDAAGQQTSYPSMYKWHLPGVATNGIRLGDGWELPAQDRLEVDVTVSAQDASKGYGRTNETAYDPVTDAAYVVAVGRNSTTRQFSVQLLKFSCVPDSGGVHRWTKFVITVNDTQMGAPASYTGANEAFNMGNCAIIDRTFYFPFLCQYNVGAGNGNYGASNEVLRLTRIVKINLDTRALSWMPLPSAMGWWLRTWDGPNNKDAGSFGDLSDIGQYRCMKAVGRKLVFGPDRHCKIGTDPWIMIYDHDAQTWTPFAPPQDNDWPNTLGNLVAVPSLGEAWLVGGIQGATPNSQGLHAPPDNAGRRIIRFKVS